MALSVAGGPRPPSTHHPTTEQRRSRPPSTHDSTTEHLTADNLAGKMTNGDFESIDLRGTRAVEAYRPVRSRIAAEPVVHSAGTARAFAIEPSRALSPELYGDAEVEQRRTATP